MAIWEPIGFIDNQGEQRMILFRVCTTTGVPIFCPDWVENGPQFNFDASDGIKAMEDAMRKAAAEDTVEGYRKAAKFKAHLDAIRKKGKA